MAKKARRHWPTKDPIARGYGSEHRRLRAHWQQVIDAGEEVLCVRCYRPILPRLHAFDLDHTEDRLGWLGPAHRFCNRSHAARKGNALRAQQKPLRPKWRTSREW
jgi:hypothetical protein